MTTKTKLPGQPARWVADLLRLVALISIVVAATTQPVEGPVRFAGIFALLLLVRPRVPGPLDATFAGALLVAAWANGLGWYETHPWVDIPIHFATNAAGAVVIFFALTETGAIPRRRPAQLSDALMITFIGGTLSVVWEIYEWTASRFIPNQMVVGYSDTIGDETMGTLGSLLAGVLVARWLHAHAHPSWPDGAPFAAPEEARE